MVNRARIRFVPLKNTLVNLPLSIYSPLVQAQKRPQSLAIHVLAKDGQESHIGWTGLSSSNVEGRNDWLEVDPGVAGRFGWKEGDEVELSIIHFLPKAKSISVAPLEPEDWDLISLHADYLESNLLFHVRTCSLGQVLDVWLKGKSKVSMRVERLDPSSSSTLLLSQDTEVVISPLLRRSAPKPSLDSQNPKSIVSLPKSQPKPVSPSTKPASSRPLKLTAPSGPSTILRVLPLKLVESLSSASHSWDCKGKGRAVSTPLSLRPPIDPRDSVVLLSSASLSTFHPSPQASSSKSTLTALSIIIITPSYRHNPTLASESQPPPTPDDSEAPLSQPDSTFLTLSLQIHDSIPFGHLVFSSPSSSRPIADWEVVRVSASSSSPLPSEGLAQSTEGDGSSTAVREGKKMKGRLPGVEGIVRKVLDFLVNSLVLQSGMFFSTSRSGSTPPRTLLLTGNAGSGKTSIALELASLLQADERTLAYTIHFDCAKLASTPIPAIREELKRLIAEANWHRPSLLILDNLDAICSAELEHTDSTRSRHISEFFVSLFSPLSPANFLRPGTVVIATAKSVQDLHPVLGAKHVFGERLSVGGLGKVGRRDVLSCLVNAKTSTSPLRLSSSDPINYTALSTQTEGYSPSDLKDLVDRAVQEAAMRSIEKPASSSADGDRSIVLTLSDFTSAQAGFVPLSLRDIKLHKSDVKWEDIGGLQATRQTLRETLEWPTKYGAIFSQSPLRLRSGLLLYGYPGCGKTLLASAVAKECGLNFISVKGPEILNKYIGASEKSVRDLFERASAAKPCVLFFDEFDSIAPKRGHDSTGVTDRVVNQMLTQMDGAEGLDGVYVLAATSRPDLIDPALLRPGRLDKSLLCDMPSEEDRLEILLSLTRNLPLDPSISLPSLAAQTEHFTGADLGGLIGTAHLSSIHATIDEPKNGASGSAEKDGELGGEVIRIGGGKKSKGKAADGAGVGESRAKMMERKKREAVIFGSKGSSASTDDQSKTEDIPKRELLILPSHLTTALTTSRPSVPAAERIRLSKIYGAFVNERSKGEARLKGADEGMGEGVGSRASLG